jgi:arginine:ornithine antiporter/lysine permease
MYQSQLAKLSNPSTADILQSAVGAWGGVLMNAGVIIALLSSWLAFTLMIVQIPYAAALDGTFPKVFTRENDNGTPTVSLWISSLLMQICMILVYFSNNAWNTMLSITSVMILPPYFACTLYLWKMCVDKKLSAKVGISKDFALICGVLGSVYAIWMIYAAGLKYLVLAFIFQLVSIPVYLWATKEVRESDMMKQKKLTPFFSNWELVGMCALVFIAFLAIALTIMGKIKI